MFSYILFYLSDVEAFVLASSGLFALLPRSPVEVEPAGSERRQESLLARHADRIQKHLTHRNRIIATHLVPGQKKTEDSIESTALKFNG